MDHRIESYTGISWGTTSFWRIDCGRKHTAFLSTVIGVWPPRFWSLKWGIGSTCRDNNDSDTTHEGEGNKGAEMPKLTWFQTKKKGYNLLYRTIMVQYVSNCHLGITCSWDSSSFQWLWCFCNNIQSMLSNSRGRPGGRSFKPSSPSKSLCTQFRISERIDTKTCKKT